MELAWVGFVFRSTIGQRGRAKAVHKDRDSGDRRCIQRTPVKGS